MIKIFEKFDLESIKKLASDEEIKPIDHELINRIALFALNTHKKYRIFSLWRPYDRYPIFKDYERIQFVIDRNLKYSSAKAYYEVFEQPNGKEWAQIVCRELNLESLHHEIQHLIHNVQYNFNELNSEAWELSELKSYAEKLKLIDISCFFHDIYITIPDEVESYMSEIYQGLLKKRTTQKTFDENLKGIVYYDDFYDIIDDTYKDYYLNKLKNSSRFRVEFFSELNNFLENTEDLSKLKYKSDLLSRLFFQGSKYNLKYDVKLPQEEADKMAKFWIDYFKKRTDDIFVRINNIKYLFKP